MGEEELDRVRRQEEIGTLLAWQTTRGSAEALGSALLVDGDWHAAALRLERVRRLTPADLQRAAARVLVGAGRNVLWVVPAKPPAGVPAGTGGGGAAPGDPPAGEDADHDHALQNARPRLRAGPRGRALRRLPPGLAAADLSAFRMPVPVVRTLPNGLRVAVFQDRRLPFVQMQLLLPAGVAQEAAATPGAATFTAQLLRAGTTSRTAEGFAADVDYLGGSLVGTAARDYSTVSGTFLAADFEAGLELLADAVVNPVFPPEEVERFRSQSAGLLLQARQDPAALAEDRLWALAFEGHPYGRNPLGTLESLARMDREAVRAFHRDFYRPDRAVLAIAGDVDPERAFAVANDRFGNWAGRAVTPPRAPAPAAAGRDADPPRGPSGPGPERGAHRPRLSAAHRPGRPAAPGGELHPRRRGLSSRLSQSLRVDGGLSYDVRSSHTILRDAGLISLGTVARNDSVAILVGRMRDELARLRTQPPGEAEVTAARRYFENSYPLQFQTPGGARRAVDGRGLLRPHLRVARPLRRERRGGDGGAGGRCRVPLAGSLAHGGGRGRARRRAEGAARGAGPGGGRRRRGAEPPPRRPPRRRRPAPSRRSAGASC